MRPIKFRFWVESIIPEETGLYYPGYFLSGTKPNGEGWFDKLHTTNKEGVGYKFTDDTSKIIPMQFTGLLDKNGKEIYDGDIVIWRGYSSDGRPCPKCGHTESGDMVMKIWSVQGQWVHTSENTEEGYYSFEPDNARRVEVIGNIYEHKELLS